MPDPYPNIFDPAEGEKYPAIVNSRNAEINRAVGPPQETLWSPGGDWAREGAIEQIRQRRMGRQTVSQPGSDDAPPASAPPRPTTFEGSPVIKPLSAGEQLARRNPHNPNYVPPPPQWDEEEQRRQAAEARNPNPSQRNWVPGGPAAPVPGNIDPPDPRRLSNSTPRAIEIGDEGGTDAPDPRQLSNSPPKTITLPGKPQGGGGGGGRAGAGGGGGGGGAGRGRLPLGDQRRTEAYDPTLDRTDPRNIGIIDEQGRTNPKLREQAERGAIDPTAPGVKTGEQAQKFTNQYTKAMAGAATYLEDMFHQKKGDPNQAEGYHALTYKATGAPDDKVVGDVFRVIDPNNELSPKERMELATRAMHDWYSAHGDTKNADKVAAEMLQYGNKQAQMLGRQVLEAAKRGDNQAAAQALKAAYDWLPDGMTADVKGNSLVITDNKGQVASNIPLDPKMIHNLGVGLATGTVYMDLVAQRAGKPGVFSPPTPQPTQAIAATAPGRQPWDERPDPGPTTPFGTGATPGGPAAAPPSGAAPAGRPVTQAGPARPAQAPPPPPAARAAAPAAPPSASGGPQASPPAAPQATPRGNQPPQITSPLNDPNAPEPQQLTRPPQNNQSEAPAPAAPGPAPIDQATGKPVEQGDGGPSGSPAGQQGEASAIDKADRGDPIVVSRKREPVAMDVKVPPRLSSDPGEQKKPDQPKPVTRVWDKDDPDTVPTRSDNGKPVEHLERSQDLTPEAKAAQKEIAAIDAAYRDRKSWIFSEAGKSKSPTYKAKVAALEKRIDTEYRADRKRAEDVLKEFRDEQKAGHKEEKERLKPQYPNAHVAQQQATDIEAQLKEYMQQKDKWALTPINPLRLITDEKKLAPIRDTVMEIWAHNRTVPINQLTDAVLTMMSHVEKTPNAQMQKANEGAGSKGSYFVVLGQDPNKNPVVQVGHTRNKLVLHMPENTLNQIKDLKIKSYEAKAKPLEEKAKSWDKAQGVKKIVPEAFKPIVGKTVDKLYGKDRPEVNP